MPKFEYFKNQNENRSLLKITLRNGMTLTHIGPSVNPTAIMTVMEDGNSR
jgi:hypothetical protein